MSSGLYHQSAHWQTLTPLQRRQAHEQQSRLHHVPHRVGTGINHPNTTPNTQEVATVNPTPPPSDEQEQDDELMKEYGVTLDEIRPPAHRAPWYYWYAIPGAIAAFTRSYQAAGAALIAWAAWTYRPPLRQVPRQLLSHDHHHKIRELVDLMHNLNLPLDFYTHRSDYRLINGVAYRYLSPTEKYIGNWEQDHGTPWVGPTIDDEIDDEIDVRR